MNEQVESNILGRMVEVTLARPEDFLVVKETLTRIGVASSQSRTLTQSCHILHKRGRYFITHFKLLFELDGKMSNFNEEDESRMNTIAMLLESWKLLSVVDKSSAKKFCPVKRLKIIPANERDEWTLVSKHRIGNTTKQ